MAGGPCRMQTGVVNNSTLIHIKVSDTGWILEKLAREITSRLPYVTYDTAANSDAAIQYYMTYGCRQERISPIEIALFTHKEQVPSAAEKFEKVASEVDYCVAQSLATAAILTAQEIEKVTTISPGVDLDRFAPMVRIGVVGRTYHTGRKGEALVASVMDIPGIDWHFTGKGWPGPAEFVADEDMPTFYRSLDYVLVPALIEGGPMCVLEALASGCEVIAPPVGWVPQFPHIGFKLGDPGDLRRVLLELVKKKADLRKSVEAYTWDAWASQHHQLFTKLLGYDPLQRTSKASILPYIVTEDRSPFKAAVLVHGKEMTASLGGPSVRAPRTASALRRIGVAADFLATRDYDAAGYDVSHVFNVWHPNSSDILLQQIEKACAASVLSPIFMDLTELPYFQLKVPQILTDSLTAEEAISQFAEQRDLLAERGRSPVQEVEPLPGYFSMVRLMTSRVHHLILLSEHERKLLKSIGVDHPSTSIVKNPVDATMFGKGDPALFQEAYGVTDYVLCVGRIETRKNQALLTLALRDTDIPLVLVGHEADARYADLIRKWGNDKVIFAGRMEPGGAMLASALAGARVFCLPSWSEGAPLAALEAAAAGCNMVLSNRSSEQEYFGDLARYVDPADPLHIREKILEAYADTGWEGRKSRLIDLIKSEHSWEHYAKGTADAYIQAKARRDSKELSTQQLVGENAEIFVDVTTLAHHKGPPTGIARVEDRLINEMIQEEGKSCRFVLWNSHFKTFLEVSPADITSGHIKLLSESKSHDICHNSLEQTPFSEVNFPEGGKLVVLGSAWMRNARYLDDVRTVKWARNLTLVSAIYDVIQFNHKDLYPKEASTDFIENCTKFIDISDLILTCSEQSRRDIVEMCTSRRIAIPPIRLFRLGDEAKSIDRFAVLQNEIVDNIINNKQFVLCVSSIDARKNHRMLLTLWQRLIRDFGDLIPPLVLVGRIGWKGEEILQFLGSDRALQEKVIMLHDINDQTLEWLYKNCLFTVYPSLYEGWGLPVAESLVHGKFCIASDGGSLSEVAPGYVEYINPLDFMGWYKALKRYIFTPTLLEQRTKQALRYTPTSWTQTAAQVRTAIATAGRTSQLSVLSAETKLDLTAARDDDSRSVHNYLLSGWGRVEAGGIWTVGTLSMMAFRLDQAADGDLMLQLCAFGYAADVQPVQVMALVNGATVTRWTIGASPAIYYAPIAPNLIGDDPSVRVEFQILNPRSPAWTGNSNDIRLLGFSAQSISLRKIHTLAPGELRTFDDIAAPELVLRRPDHLADAKFLSFTLELACAGNVDVLIDRKVVFSFATRADEKIAHAIDLSDLVEHSQDAFELSFAMAGSKDGIRVLQVGFVKKRPIEVLRQAVIPFRGSHSHNCHVPFAGNAPRLANDNMTPDSLVNGMAGGWHALEPSGVWTNGRPASLYVKPDATSSSRLVVNVCYSVFAPLRDGGASFYIKAGTQEPRLLIVEEDESMTSGGLVAQIEYGPEDVDTNGNLAISFFSSGAMAPSALANSADNRLLAIKFHGLVGNDLDHSVFAEEFSEPSDIVETDFTSNSHPIAARQRWHGA
jgi:glycosyltransferase involved in cell wall biosynthesis